MDDNVGEFVAYSRKLLRVLKKLRRVLDNGDIENVKLMLDDLIEDMEIDIEA